MSLHNSYGVALHHLNIGNKIDKIPQQSIYHYRIARNIFRKYPNNEYMKKIMKKVRSNSGRIVRGGGSKIQDFLIKYEDLSNDTC